jgi:lipopolysaccharide assembly protein A
MFGVLSAREAVRRAGMRIIQAILLLAFLGVVGVFAVQNTRSVTVDFWTWEVTGPVAAVIAAVYMLGMLSGWTVVAFVRRSLRRVGERSSGSA